MLTLYQAIIRILKTPETTMYKTPFTIDDRIIDDDHAPFIIADACNNFNNDITVALELCDAAKMADVDAIKFQMRLQPDRLAPDQHAVIAEYCKKIDLTWLCSAFSEEGFAHVTNIGVPVHKIPSGQMSNHDLIRKVCTYGGRPLIVSLGMSEWAEIRALNRLLDDEKIPYALMQCTSIYPCPYEEVQLDVIRALQENLGAPAYVSAPVGLSDHTPTIWTAIGAVALGARIIEKHITFDTADEGPDHASSLQPEDFAVMVEGCRAVWEARGTHKRIAPREIPKAAIHKFGAERLYEISPE
jgi:N-acetylneuraminate synthase